MFVPTPVPGRRARYAVASAATARRQGWVIWCVLLGGMAAFAAFVGLRTPPPAGSEGIALDVMALAAGGMLALCATAGLVVRTVTWSRAEREGAVPPRAWLTGNIVLWALIEGPTFFGLVVVMMGGPVGWRAAIPAAGIAAFLVANPGWSSSRLAGAPVSAKGGEYAARGAPRDA